MKVLHTSDWHLGQHFIGKSRAAEHQKFISWLLVQITEHYIDAVIIAGDVFDTGAPPSYAREMYNQFVVEINKLGCQLVVLAGNHDSVATLNESKALLAYLNTSVVANVTQDLSSQVLVLNQIHGDKKGEPGAVLCAIPYIRPKDVLISTSGESGKDKQQALGQAIKDHYANLYQLAIEKKSSLKLDLPVIATGHLMALGVKSSDSVRDIYIGSLEAFSAAEFPAANYIALGHIHRPQVVAKSEHIRYCGSPIPLSFDELGTDKQVLIAEFSDGKLDQVTTLKVPVFQPMNVIKGGLQEIETQLKSIDNPADELPIWLYIEVETQDYLTDLQQRVVKLTQDLNVEVLQLKRARTNRQVAIESQQKEVLAELTPSDVFEKRLALENFETQEEQQRLSRIKQTFNCITADIQEAKE